MSSKLDYSFNDRGRLGSLRSNGLEFAAEDDGALFLAQLRDLVGNPVRISATDFAKVTCEMTTDGGTAICYGDCTKVRDTTAKVTVTRVSPVETRWGIEIHLGMDTLQVEWIDFPRVRIQHAAGGQLLLFAIDGRLLGTARVDSEGTAQIALDTFPQGVYVLKSNELTFKALKR